jgi:DNA-binding NtrC family response regulator
MKDIPYPPFSILMVDDETSWLHTLSLSLERSAGITNLISCQDSRQVMDLMAKHEIGIVLLDLTMPNISGEDLLHLISEDYPDVSVIVISGLNQLETAVRCVQAGAFDYFVKSSEEDRIIKGVRRAIRWQELQKESSEMRRMFLDDTMESPEAFASIVTQDKGMRSIFHYIEAVAKGGNPVLITGESGTGKELIARAIHTLSHRTGSLVAVNVAGLDESVFTDTLFGHTRGAFTGAAEARSGMVERATDGTLFLDEIGDLQSSSQVKLLRLLQEGEYYPLGSDRPRWMRARVVVATNQNLAEKQATGAFRKDLYYRLRSHHVHLPALRDRKGDIPMLLDHFLEKAALEFGKKKPTPPKELAVLLANYGFPGNVRELKSMVYDAVGSHQGRILSMDAFKRAIGEHDGVSSYLRTDTDNPYLHLDRLPTLRDAHELLVQDALRRSEGNQSLAAKMLGVTQSALSKRLKFTQRKTV